MARSATRRTIRELTAAGAGAVLGTIVSIDAEGRALVTYAGAKRGGVRARSVLDASARVGADPAELVGAQVLLFFEEEDLSRPIVVGLVREALQPPAAPPELKLDLGPDKDVLVDGRRVVLDAQQEIQLRCGKSTITLQRDGKVLIRGAHLVSRSSGPNKIKGGTISLN